MKKANYTRATIFGLVFGAVASLIWYGIVVLTGWQLGLVAIAVGFIVGTGVVFGAGNKTGENFQFLAAGLTFVSLLLSEYFITNHMVYKYVTEQFGSVSYFLQPAAVIDTMFAALGDHPFTLVFWGIAIYVGYGVPKARSHVNPKK